MSLSSQNRVVVGNNGSEEKSSNASSAEIKDDFCAQYRAFYLKTPALVYIQRCKDEAGKANPSQVPYYEFLQRIQHLSAEDKVAIEDYIENSPEYKVLAEEYVPNHSADQSSLTSTNFLILGHLVMLDEMEHYASDCFNHAWQLATIETTAIAKFNQVFALLAGFTSHADINLILGIETLYGMRYKNLGCGLLDFWNAMRGDARAFMDNYYQGQVSEASIVKAKFEKLNAAVRNGYFPARHELGQLALTEMERTQVSASPESKMLSGGRATIVDCGLWEDKGLEHLKLAACQGHTESLTSLARAFAGNSRVREEAMHCYDALLAVKPCPQLCHELIVRKVAPSADPAKYLRFAFNNGALAVLDTEQCIHLLVSLLEQQELQKQKEAKQKEAKQQNCFGLELRDYMTGLRAALSVDLDLAYKSLANNAVQALSASPQALSHAVLCYAEDEKFELRPVSKEACVTEMLVVFNQLVCAKPDVFLTMHEFPSKEEQENRQKQMALGIKDFQAVLTNRFLTQEAQDAVRGIMVAALRATVRFPEPLMRLMVSYAEPFFAAPYQGLTARQAP